MDLNLKIEDITRILPVQKKALDKIGLKTIGDLLYHFPSRYISSTDIKNIIDLNKGDSAILHGKISHLKMSKAFRKKIPMAEAWLEDDTGKIKIVWFHQPYIAKMIKEGIPVRVEGKIAERRSELYVSNPEVVSINKIPIEAGSPLFEKKKAQILAQPSYPESRGITSKWFYHTIQRIFSLKEFKNIEDPIPEEILNKYNLPKLKTALIWIHTPKREFDAVAARKRFAFEEVFFIQLQKQKQRKEYEKEPSFKIEKKFEDVKIFIERFPFNATSAQERAIKQILKDFNDKHAMSRLLEGDVGSGKTAVAATTAYSVVTTRPNNSSGQKQDFGNLQVAYMVPTEILAKQHFESFIEFFQHLPIQIGLITSSGCKKFPSKVSYQKYTDISRSQLLKWVENGEIPILVGTHSLIQKSVKFRDLAYIIIDEQHRFGVRQRQALARKCTQIKEPQINADNETQIDADNETQMSADTNNTSDIFLYKDLSYTLRNIAFTIHNQLGCGHKESIYQNAFEEELKKRNIYFEKEKRIDIFYNKKKIGIYQPDFIVENKVVVELKALPFIGKREETQIWNYLKGSTYSLVLLINFGAEKVEIKRIVYDTARKNSHLRASASNLHQSANRLPHLLSMTATPIPRTLALTIYGDLDLTLLDEMPAGRKTVITDIISPDERNKTYEEIREQLKKGRQAFVICPRINIPDPTKELALIVKSVKEEAKRLKKDVFPEFEIEILHSKIKPKEKEEIMSRFANGEIDILVSTSVVEVGVNVPNATMIIIEGAERFGLAQLHQLRGRVLRSERQAYCYIFTDTKTKTSLDRLRALKTAKNGFELAEKDLMLRGSGQLGGGKQWGISDIGMEAIRNIKMVEAARIEAHEIIEKDSQLKSYPLLREKMGRKDGEIHFE
ncbi:GxxExxY protein [Patescibacteria group bacterium]|nr:GxxExxY protein [Patescibacteria group bacterium]MBU4115600.1 GxxExxY protein [Patescibacteria group bacterium]